MSKIGLTIAMSDYDHVRDFANGSITAEGIDANFLTLQIEEIFHRFIKFQEWDVSEISFGKYVALRARDGSDFTSIPVFPSRIFRLSSIFVRPDGAVRKPEDLAGKKVGIPEWAQTAAIYTRGYLMHQLGIPLADIEWFQAGVNQPGRAEKVAINLPDGVSLTPVPDRSLQDLLLSGDIDAMASAHPPEIFEAGGGEIIRLVPDYKDAEETYFKDTGIFPIMHTVGIRRAIAEKYPWAPMNLFKAFEEAKRASVARAFEMTASRFPIPWGAYHADSARGLFDGEYWPYGIEANRKTLEAFLLYSYEQGVCERHLAVEELFPETVQSKFLV